VVPRSRNLGVCGVCRRPVKVGDGGGKQFEQYVSTPVLLAIHLLIEISELEPLIGIGDRNDNDQRTPYPDREGPSVPGQVGGRRTAVPRPY
jgi:hypothetical protein